MQVKTKNVLFSALIVLLVGVLWYRVVYSSMESKAAKAKTAAHEADTSAAELRGAIGGSTGANKTKAHDIPNDVMTAAVPTDDAEATFLRDLDALRVSSGANWQSITPTPPVISGVVATINVGLTVAGTEQQLKAYETGLENLKRIFVIDNLSITSTASSDPTGATVSAAPGSSFSGGTLQMQVTGRIFTQPGAVPAPATATGTATTPATVAPVTGATVAPSGVQNN